MARRGSEHLEERELIYEKLPQDIAERHVLLLVLPLPKAVNYSLLLITPDNSDSILATESVTVVLDSAGVCY